MKLTHLDKVLNEFADYAVESAQLELGTTRKLGGKKVRRVASGELQRSLFHKTFTRKGKKTIGFGAKGTAGDYAAFIHEGVNGTLKNNGAPFSFKKKNLARGVVAKWMKVKRIRPKDKNGKFLKMTPANMKSAAFMIGRSIAQNGIVGLPFMKLGVERSLRKYDKKILEALGKDAFDNLTT
jgi:hypothetical protein